MSHERCLYRNEQYPSFKNLTPEQDSYQHMWDYWKTIQLDRLPVPWAGFGLRLLEPPVSSRKHNPVLTDGRAQFQPSQLILPLSRVRLISLCAIPSEHWHGAPSRRAYRFNAMEQGFYVDEACGVYAGGPGQSGHPAQWDFSQSPFQDYPDLSIRRYSINSVGGLIEKALEEATGQHRELVAPFAGEYRLTRDQLFIHVMLGKTMVFRLYLEEADRIKFSPERRVAAGEVLATFGDGDFTYGEAKFWYDRNEYRTKYHRPPPHILPATRKAATFRVLNGLLDQITRLVVEPTNSPARPRLSPSYLWAPVPLAVFPYDVFRRLTVEPGWTVCPELQSRILQALGPFSPDSSVQPFVLKAPVTGTIVSMEDRGPLGTIQIRDVNGRTIPMSTPRMESVQLRPGIEVGTTIEKGQELGDPVPRLPYQSWSDLDLDANAALPWLVKEYLSSVALTADNPEWEQEGVGIDARLVTSVLSLADDWQLDLRPCAPYLHQGVIVFPPVKQANWKWFQFKLNDIGYDITPMDDVVVDRAARPNKPPAAARSKQRPRRNKQPRVKGRPAQNPPPVAAIEQPLATEPEYTMESAMEPEVAAPEPPAVDLGPLTRSEIA